MHNTCRRGFQYECVREKQLCALHLVPFTIAVTCTCISNNEPTINIIVIGIFDMSL